MKGKKIGTISYIITLKRLLQDGLVEDGAKSGFISRQSPELVLWGEALGIRGRRYTVAEKLDNALRYASLRGLSFSEA